jgi:hypothetical protein
MATLTEADLLALWEAGLGMTWQERALALAAATCDAGVDELAGLTVGRRDGLLLMLRRRCFGPQLPCTVGCPCCGDPLEFTLPIDDIMLGDSAAAQDAPVRADIAGVEVTFRAPTCRDLLAAGSPSPGARRALVTSCIVEARKDAEPTPADALSDEIVDAVAARLGEADPQADIVIAIVCQSCGHQWNAPFDTAGYVWAEVDAHARRLLHDIRVLASAFGWTEPEVLAVSPARRRFYLEGAAG